MDHKSLIQKTIALTETKADNLFEKAKQINEAIENPNSSGQGYDPEHEKHFVHNIAQKHGYKYSHSSPIHRRDGSTYIYHTWKQKEHVIGAPHDGSNRWNTQTSTSSGHHHHGIGEKELDKHLTYKGKKYLKEEEIDEARRAMPLRGHLYHTHSDDQLHYIMKDAHRAAQAMKSHDTKAEAKYLDQLNDAATVLGYRKRGGKRVEVKKDVDEANGFVLSDDEIKGIINDKRPEAERREGAKKAMDKALDKLKKAFPAGSIPRYKDGRPHPPFKPIKTDEEVENVEENWKYLNYNSHEEAAKARQAHFDYKNEDGSRSGNPCRNLGKGKLAYMGDFKGPKPTKQPKVTEDIDMSQFDELIAEMIEADYTKEEILDEISKKLVTKYLDKTERKSGPDDFVQGGGDYEGKSRRVGRRLAYKKLSNNKYQRHSRVPATEETVEEEFKPGDKVHFGLAQKGGAGFGGVLVKIDDDGMAHVRSHEKGKFGYRTWKGHKSRLSPNNISVKEETMSELDEKKLDIYAATRARQLAKDAEKEKDTNKKSELERRSAEYKSKIRKEEVDDDEDYLIDEMIEAGYSDDEIINEISKKTLKSYVKKGTTSANRANARGEKEEDKAMSTDGNKYPEKQMRHVHNADKEYTLSDKRAKGIALAKSKLSGKSERLYGILPSLNRKAKVLASEEVENIDNLFSDQELEYLNSVGELDEISKDKLKKYQDANIKNDTDEGPSKKGDKRLRNFGLAGRKIMGKRFFDNVKVPATEETEITEDQYGQYSSKGPGVKSSTVSDNNLTDEVNSDAKRSRGRPKKGEEENSPVLSPVMQIKNAAENQTRDDDKGEYTLTHPVTNKKFTVSHKEANKHYSDYYKLQKPNEKLRHEMNFLHRHTGDERISKD